MTPLPDNIRRFIQRQHVVGLATLFEGEPWAASCFYAFDAESVALIILSDPATRHGQAMLATPRIAGTIAGQPKLIPKIQGIQFTAEACLLRGQAAETAYGQYCQRHPIARLKRSEVWQLALLQIKFTDNSLLQGSKTHWQRDTATSHN